MGKGWVWGTAKYLLAFGLLAVVAAQAWDPPGGRGLRDVWRAHVEGGRPVRVGPLLAAAALLAGCVTVGQLRWFLLVRAQGLPVRLPTAMRLGWVGFVFNTLLPGSVGGDLVKAAALARSQERQAAAVATVVMDRVIGLWSLALFVAVAGGWAWANGWLDGPGTGPARVIAATAGGVVAASVPVLLLVRCLGAVRAERLVARVGRVKAVGAAAGGLLAAALLYRDRGRCLARAVALSGVIQTFAVLQFLCCVTAFWDGQPDNPLPAPGLHLLIVPVAQLVAAVPLFPGGAGIGEAGYGGLYALFGSAPASGVLGSLVQRALGLAIAGVGMLVYLTYRPRVAPATGEHVEGPSPAGHRHAA